jgi:hypothetical protein
LLWIRTEVALQIFWFPGFLYTIDSFRTLQGGQKHVTDILDICTRQKYRCDPLLALTLSASGWSHPNATEVFLPLKGWGSGSAGQVTFKK